MFVSTYTPTSKEVIYEAYTVAVPVRKGTVLFGAKEVEHYVRTFNKGEEAHAR